MIFVLKSIILFSRGYFVDSDIRITVDSHLDGMWGDEKSVFHYLCARVSGDKDFFVVFPFPFLNNSPFISAFELQRLENSFSNL